MKRSDSIRAFHSVQVCNRLAVCLFLLPLIWISSDWGTATAGKKNILRLPEGTERVCVSLRVLSKELKKARSSGAKIPQELLHLNGIGYLEGFIVDEAGEKDIILVGRKSENRPALYLDDLVVGMQSAGNQREYPYCTLDPLGENVLALQRLFHNPGALTSPSEMRDFFQKVKSTIGPQQAIVGGVPRNSRHAHVMINADYDMKKVSQGHTTVSRVSSYLDLYLDKATKDITLGQAAEPTGASMARFWFHVGEGAPTFQEGKGIVWIDDCPVVLLTEKQLPTQSGDLIDVDEDDPTAGAFAENFSEEFTNVADSVALYSDLENLFRLRALLLAMTFRNSLSKSGMGFQSFISEYIFLCESPMDPFLPGLANFKERSFTKYYLFPIVCGGVGMDMIVKESSFSDVHGSQLFSLRMEALLARPSKDSPGWVIPATR